MHRMIKMSVTMFLCFTLRAILPIPVLMYGSRLMSINKDLLTYLGYLQCTLVQDEHHAIASRAKKGRTDG